MEARGGGLELEEPVRVGVVIETALENRKELKLKACEIQIACDAS
jgi:hypothetical protein